MARPITVQFFPDHNNQKSFGVDQHNRMSKPYSFLTDIDVKPGDQVIVPSAGIPKVAVVEKIFGLSRDAHNKAATLIIAKLDMSDYDDRVALVEKANELKTRLAERKQQFEEREIYRLMAENDPEARMLMDELNKIEGNVIEHKPAEEPNPFEKEEESK